MYHAAHSGIVAGRLDVLYHGDVSIYAHVRLDRFCFRAHRFMVVVCHVIIVLYGKDYALRAVFHAVAHFIQLVYKSETVACSRHLVKQ